MVYFDKEKGEFVWQHFYNGNVIENMVYDDKKLNTCFIAISSAKYTEEDVTFIKNICEKKKLDYVILPAIPNSFEDHLRFALNYLNSENAVSQHCNIKKGYDYAWIKRVIDKKLFLGAERLSNEHFPPFINYIKRLGFANIASSTVLSRYYNYVKDRNQECLLPWFYEDCVNDKNETNRRNSIASTFAEIMTEFWGS